MVPVITAWVWACSPRAFPSDPKVQDGNLLICITYCGVFLGCWRWVQSFLKQKQMSQLLWLSTGSCQSHVGWILKDKQVGKTQKLLFPSHLGCLGEWLVNIPAVSCAAWVALVGITALHTGELSAEQKMWGTLSQIQVLDMIQKTQISVERMQSKNLILH